MTPIQATFPPRNTRLTSAEHTRLSLVHAGLKLFGEKGFEGTATREIAGLAGANIGSISYHFGGKEGLRIACADHIVALIGEVAAGALEDAADDGGPPSAEHARAVFDRIVERMIGFVMTRPEAGLIVSFILREMTHPTVALDRIYEGIFDPVHRRLCVLWAAATGAAAESDETKLTVFTLIGQVVYFRIAGEAVRRRMGWREIGHREAKVITDIAKVNLKAILTARGTGGNRT